jgi:hypothetical protein
MFQLSENHLDAFRGIARGVFETRGVAHLSRRLPKQTAPYDDEQLRERIRSCIPRANRYNLTTQREVMAFVDTTYLSHEHFDTDPSCHWAQAVLGDREVAPDLKANLLVSFAYRSSVRG